MHVHTPRSLRVALVAAVATIAVIALTGCASPAPASPAALVATAPSPTVAATPEPTPETTPEATPEPTAEPTDTPEPSPTPLALAPRGTIVRAGDWDVKVTGPVNFNAWKVVHRENMFNDPAPKGWSMVLVPLQVWNRGDAPGDLLGEMGYVVGDATGVEVTDFDDPSCGVIPKELDAFTTVRVGGTLKGNMCFVVDNADLKSLRMGWPTGLFSDQPDVELALR